MSLAVKKRNGLLDFEITSSCSERPSVIADVICKSRIESASKVNEVKVVENALHSVLTNDTADSVALRSFLNDVFANLSLHSYFFKHF